MGVSIMNKKLKRHIVIAVSAAMVITCCYVTPVMNAAKKASLVRKVITLSVGQKKNVSIKNRNKKYRYTFSSSKKSVVTVNAKGKLSARKKGKARITVKEINTSGKKRLLGKVNVKVSTPKNITTKNSNDVNSINETVHEKTPSYQPVVAPTLYPGVNVSTAEPLPTTEPMPTATTTPEPTFVPFSTMVEVSKLEEHKELPDVMKFMDGSEVTKDNWNVRAAEIRDMYQYYMYGMWRDGEGENLDYSITPGDDVEGGKAYILKLNIATDGSVVGQKTDGKTSFGANVYIPEGNAPETGWPVFIIMGDMSERTNALTHGYAVISFDTAEVSADSASHKGAFYDLYPYESDWKKQSGVLMAWAWGTSKIVDSLYAGVGDELSIDKTFTIAGGVSRWGKATAVAGAFDTRIKISMPTCSGCGGMAVFRYNPNAEVTQKYDVSSLGYQQTAEYTKGDIETLGSLQSSGESYWFNSRFMEFRSIYKLPFDQHFLSTLYAEKGRTLMLIGGFCYDIWQNTPSLWYNFQRSHEVFKMLGLGDNEIINLHDTAMGHNIVTADVDILFKYCDEMYNSRDVDNFSISDMHTTLFDLEVTPSGINNKEIYQAMIPE